MTKELAFALRDEIRNFDEDAELRLDYSGRGMDGQQTAALVYSSDKDLMCAVYRLGRYGKRDKKEPFLEEEGIRALRHDTLGRNKIVY